ncbi:ATP-binding protein [Kalymmatonema gypsitolerans NIES-4073]|nr:ATP-binding protein [Scytonema sp. NIES-4073]
MVNTNARAFTQELLNKSSEDKTCYFKSITVPHRKLKEALDRLLINILEPADTLVFLVFCVTGVGKTTLRLRLEKLLLERFLPELQVNPGKIAVASVEAIPAERGNFSHKDYYIRALESLNEVLIEYKSNYKFSWTDNDNKDLGLINQSNRKDAPTLRRAMEKVFRYRQLRCFLVDEAQHLLMMSGGHQMLHQMNWIKSIANLTGIVHILFGTYELLNCSTLNGQVGRRSEDIHLTPYQLDEAEDVTEFIRVIRTLEKHLPLEEEPCLENYYEYLFSGSVGCVGILKIRLCCALADWTFLFKDVFWGYLGTTGQALASAITERLWEVSTSFSTLVSVLKTCFSTTFTRKGVSTKDLLKRLK